MEGIDPSTLPPHLAQWATFIIFIFGSCIAVYAKYFGAKKEAATPKTEELTLVQADLASSRPFREGAASLAALVEVAREICKTQENLAREIGGVASMLRKRAEMEEREHQIEDEVERRLHDRDRKRERDRRLTDER